MRKYDTRGEGGVVLLLGVEGVRDIYEQNGPSHKRSNRKSSINRREHEASLHLKRFMHNDAKHGAHNVVGKVVSLVAATEQTMDYYGSLMHTRGCGLSVGHGFQPDETNLGLESLDLAKKTIKINATNRVRKHPNTSTSLFL